VAGQRVSNCVQEGPSALVVLISLSGYQVSRKLVEMIKYGTANLFVGGAARPEVWGYSARDAKHVSERGATKFFIFCHKKCRPGPEVVKKPVEFRVYLMGIGNFSVGLFDILHNVDDLAQDSVESVDRLIWWHVGGRKASFSEIPGTDGLWKHRQGHPLYASITA
jgi:hypothetical protein